ncbi:hypothetical protein QQ045_030968 [Rhodiola kirilowii]
MYDAVNKYVIPVAMRLSVGYPIALAPPVLASIYRGLTSMKIRLLKMPKFWVWERFLRLRPEPNVINRPDEPRIALWANVNKGKRKPNIRS